MKVNDLESTPVPVIRKVSKRGWYTTSAAMSPELVAELDTIANRLECSRADLIVHACQELVDRMAS